MRSLQIWVSRTSYGGTDGGAAFTCHPVARVGSMRAGADGWMPDDRLREWMPGLPWYPDRGSALDAMLAAVRCPGREGHYVVTCGYRRPNGP